MNRKVKSLMVLKGITGVDIAKRLDISPNTIYVVIGGYGKSRRIQEAIANALSMRVEELWPEKKDSGQVRCGSPQGVAPTGMTNKKSKAA